MALVRAGGGERCGGGGAGSEAPSGGAGGIDPGVGAGHARPLALGRSRPTASATWVCVGSQGTGCPVGEGEGTDGWIASPIKAPPLVEPAKRAT